MKRRQFPKGSAVAGTVLVFSSANVWSNDADARIGVLLDDPLGEISPSGWSGYEIGTFDGSRFTAESPMLHYAEGKNLHGYDVLYAAQSFGEMPDGRRIQVAWERIPLEWMPCTRMILFPTEFKLKTTKDGLRLQSVPIDEMTRLRSKARSWSNLTVAEANQKLGSTGSEALDVEFEASIENGDGLTIRNGGNDLTTIAPEHIENGRAQVEVLIDKGVAEIFPGGGARYITREIPLSTRGQGLELSLKQKASVIEHLEIYEMKSMWTLRT